MSNRRPFPSRYKQSGAAVLVLLVVIIMGSAYMLVSKLNKGAGMRNNQQQDVEALAQARDALIGAAVLSNVQPGRLPCPDLTNDGVSATNCPTPATQVGHLPWQTLGLRDLRDSSGERLWYAVANSHRPGGSAQINSDTAATLTIDGAPAPDVVAVVFAPGRILDGQNRANPNNLVNYLEDDNADLDANLVTQAPPPPVGAPPNFNDRQTAVTRSELMKHVERHVVAEVRIALNNYFATPGNDFFPYAAELGDPLYNCADTLTRGRLPLATGAPPTLPVCSGVPGLLPFLPGWFTANNWQEVVYYTIAPACAPGTTGCSGAGFLTVNNLPAPGGKRALVIAAGPSAAGQNRAPANPAITEADFMEDPENTNVNDTYAWSPVTGAENDQIRVVAP